MSTWDYRVLRHADGSLAIHEVYYDVAGNPESCIPPYGGTDVAGDDLDPAVRRDDVELHAAALRHPVLQYESFAVRRST